MMTSSARAVLRPPESFPAGVVVAGLDLVEQAALQLVSGRNEVGLGEQAVVALALQFADLVAENRQIGFATVGGARCSRRTPERRQQKCDDGDDEQRRDDDEAGHESP
jgi:hypothetical protein